MKNRALCGKPNQKKNIKKDLPPINDTVVADGRGGGLLALGRWQEGSDDGASRPACRGETVRFAVNVVGTGKGGGGGRVEQSYGTRRETG